MQATYLAADTINGVYICERDDVQDGYHNADFIDAICEDFNGVRYGVITDNHVLETIEGEYGIN